MTDGLEDELREALESASATVAQQPDFQSVVAVASALRRELSDDDADPLRELIAALDYELKTEVGGMTATHRWADDRIGPRRVPLPSNKSTP